MPKTSEPSEPYPLRIKASLDAEIQRTMDATALQKPDVMRMAMKLGLPLLRQKFRVKK